MRVVPGSAGGATGAAGGATGAAGGAAGAAAGPAGAGRKGGDRPGGLDRAWIILKFPSVEAEFRALTGRRRASGGRALHDRLRNALAEAAAREPAARALAGLHRWRRFQLWTMATEQAETLRPLDVEVR
jgi:hypothetical protein